MKRIGIFFIYLMILTTTIFTFHVIEDIIQKHPEVIEKGVLVVHSDNCEEQYKNKKTFYKMKKLAEKYDNCLLVLWCSWTWQRFGGRYVVVRV